MKRLIFSISYLFIVFLSYSQCPPASGGGFSGNFTIPSATDCSASADLTLNKNDLTLDVNSTLIINGNFTNNKNGTITVRSGAVLTITGNFTSIQNGAFVVESGGLVFIDGDFTFSKTTGGTSINIAGGVSVGGTADFNNVTKDVVISDGGVLEAESIDSDSDIDVQDGGTIHSTSGNITGTGTVNTNSNSDGDCTNGCCGAQCNANGDDLSGSGSDVLPVTLIDFTAHTHERYVELSWSTASEDNTSHFEIYKSLDGQKFTQISEVKAKGFSDSRIDYSIQDHFPSTGMNYYQLVSVDYDGFTESFDVIKSNFKYSVIAVYPNPITGNKLNLKSFSDLDKVDVLITDLMGRAIHREVLESNGNFTITFDDAIKKGIYFLKVQNQEKEFVFKTRLIIN